jgi:pimeloyl-ACP methyl ester carboxylesterase
MTGSLDTKFSRIAEELAAKNVHVEAELVDGVGHNLLLEAPGVVAATLKRVEEMARR